MSEVNEATTEEQAGLSKTKKWFAENVVNNVDDIIAIGNNAIVQMDKDISMRPSDPEIPIMMYAQTWRAIMNYLGTQQEKNSEFEIQITDRVKTGYTTSEDEDEEKVGNFTVFIKHLEPAENSDEITDPTATKTIEICTEWNARHNTHDADAHKTISTIARRHIDEFMNFKISSSEFIIPTWAIVHRQICNYIKTSKSIEDDYGQKELNICGLYTIGVQTSDEGDEEIYFIPDITMKRMMKDDEKANRLSGGSED